jgi:TonB family protein
MSRISAVAMAISLGLLTVDAHGQATAPVGQSTRGSIVGGVIDQQGGRLPGATVIAKADANPIQADHSTVTTESGLYELTGLDQGTYQVTVTQPGFKTSVRRVEVGPLETTLNVRLDLADVRETVLVRRGSSVGAGVGPSVQADPRGPTDYLQLAQRHYEGGDLAGAASFAARALELIQSQAPAVPIEISRDPNAPVRVGGNVRAPMKVRDIAPVYPVGADPTNLHGAVTIEAVIGRDGKVTAARVVEGISGLNESALGAVQQWSYKAASLNGMTVPVALTVTVNFLGGS